MTMIMKLWQRIWYRDEVGVITRAVCGFRRLRLQRNFRKLQAACERVACDELGVPNSNVAWVVDHAVDDLWGIIRARRFSPNWVADELRLALKRWSVQATPGDAVESRATLQGVKLRYKQREGAAFDDVLRDTSDCLNGPKKETVEKTQHKRGANLSRAAG